MAIKILLREFVYFFPAKEEPKSVAIVPKIVLDTGNSSPVWRPVRRLSANEREIVDKGINETLFQRILEKSRSAWQSPVALVP